MDLALNWSITKLFAFENVPTAGTKNGVFRYMMKIFKWNFGSKFRQFFSIPVKKEMSSFQYFLKVFKLYIYSQRRKLWSVIQRFLRSLSNPSRLSHHRYRYWPATFDSCRPRLFVDRLISVPKSSRRYKLLLFRLQSPIGLACLWPCRFS